MKRSSAKQRGLSRKIMRPCLTAALLFMILSHGFAQEFYKGYNWEEKPAAVKDSCIDSTDNAVYLLDKVVYEYRYNELGRLVMTETVHRIVLIRNKTAIDDFNTVALSIDTLADILSLKARAISSRGEIVMFDKGNIREIKDEDVGGSRIFAIDGIEEGGVLELLYTISRKPFLWGRRYFQSYYPRFRAEFSIICPSSLEFVLKGRNGFPEIQGALYGDTRHYTAIAYSVKGLRDEKYSNYYDQLCAADYTLSMNHNSSTRSRIYDYKHAARHFWPYFNEFQASELKIIKGFVKEAGIRKNMTEEEIIRKAELFIKTNFLIVNSISFVNNSDISTLLKIKIIDRHASVKLMAGMMREAGVDYQIVLSSDRFDKRMPEDFESWNFLDDILLYFPGIQNYVCPYATYYRLGFIPWQLNGSRALFIKKIEYQGVESGLGSVKALPVLPSSLSADSLFVEAELQADASATVYNVRYSLSGYRATYFLSVYSTSDYVEKVNTAAAYLKSIAEDADVEVESVVNAEEPGAFLQQPVVIKGSCRSEAPIERAGNTLLYNIGMLIGEQAHLYNTESRKMPVEIEYLHHFYRKIQIRLPEGYRVNNPEVLNTSVIFKKEGETLAAFSSKGSIENGFVQLVIEEQYNALLIPAADYEGFSNVINAAADFNRVRLILEKE